MTDKQFATIKKMLQLRKGKQMSCKTKRHILSNAVFESLKVTAQMMSATSYKTCAIDKRKTDTLIFKKLKWKF